MMAHYTQEQIDENRRKWFGVLRDPESKKITNKLEDPEDTNARCCLGHACHALGIEREVEFDPRKESHSVCYDSSSIVLPDTVAYMLNITNVGDFKKTIYVKSIPVSNLTQANDDTNLTPAEIADLIEDQIKNDNFSIFQ